MGVLKVIAVLLHTAGTAVMTYAWMELDHLPNNAWVVKQKGGHFQFLTIQGCVPDSPSHTEYSLTRRLQSYRGMAYLGVESDLGLRDHRS